MRLADRLAPTHAPAAVVLVRLMVGAVFVSEGLQKFLFADELGAGRFARIGLPAPDVLGPLVGVVEIACGLLLLAGWLTRLATVPLIVIMLVALATTKVPIGLERGWWAAAHEARTDWAMLTGSLFLLIVGAGPWSADGMLKRPARPG